MNALHFRTRIGLRLLARRCAAQGHDEHADQIAKALEVAEIVDATGLGIEELRFGVDEIYLGPGTQIFTADGGRLTEFLEWIIEHQDEILELIAKLLVLFA